MSASLRTLATSVVALCLISWLTTGVSAQDPPAAEVMTYANGRFERGELAEAVQLYESLVAGGYGGAALYYNLGNAYLESGDFGRAIANYLRAEEISPRNQDIEANLGLARSMTQDRIETERDSLVESVSYLGRRWITPGELGVISLMLWTFGALAMGLLIAWRNALFRVSLRAVGSVILACAFFSLALLICMIYANPYDSTGVVTAGTVEAYSGPGFQYDEKFTLHSGAEIRLVGSRHGWFKVALPGGEIRGWMPAHTVEAVGRWD